MITLQTASNPQVVGHGSIHFWLTHAWFKGHSEFKTHSGRQFGGLPMKLALHEQTGKPFMTLQLVFDPQFEGLQGSVTEILGFITLGIFFS